MGIGLDTVAAYERGGTGKHRLVDRFATDSGEQRKLLQGVGK